MKVLLHQCCGPCSLYPLKKLKEQGFDITGFFYNPNIHPYHEFYKRLENTLLVDKYFNIPYIYDETYGLTEFFKFKDVPKNIRCSYCYEVRLEKTALYAKENSFDGFTSTLLYSKYQNHEHIVDISKKLQEKYNIRFIYYDFREGWKEGINMSKELEIYRQQYCGCIYSEIERYQYQLPKQLKEKFLQTSISLNNN